ncbi:hypothetical protein D3C75_1051980 [compost metagenome]
MAEVHQALGIGDALEGSRIIPVQAFEFGQPQVPPELGGIGTIAAILHAGLKTRLGIGVAALLHQQSAAAQQHAGAHGAGLGIPGRGQFLIKMLEQGVGTQQLTPLLQQFHMA